MNERDQFLKKYNVPRGTAPLFDQYAALLIEWQSRMNLVAPSTIGQLWQRHFADSAQLVQLAPAKPSRWLDMGAGAGFPGIVVALLSGHKITLAESVGKKCRFLETVVSNLNVANVIVRNQRVESLQNEKFDIISARACAPVAKLFKLGALCKQSETLWILPKGEDVDREIAEARLSFDFSAELIPSQTDPRGRVVLASHVRRRIERR